MTYSPTLTLTVRTFVPSIGTKFPFCDDETLPDISRVWVIEPFVTFAVETCGSGSGLKNIYSTPAIIAAHRITRIDTSTFFFVDHFFVSMRILRLKVLKSAKRIHIIEKLYRQNIDLLLYKL